MADTETPDVNQPLDTPSSSAVETPAPSPSPAAPDSSPASPSDAPDDKTPSSGDSRQSDREGLLAAVKKVVETTPADEARPSTDAAGDKPAGTPSPDQAAATGNGKIPAPDATPTAQLLPDPTEG